MKKKLDWHDPYTHTAIFPIPSRDAEIEGRLADIGIHLMHEIEIPLDIGVKFMQGMLPTWLKYKPEEDDDADDGSVKCFQFYDAKDRPRVRILVGSGMTSTQVWTRYRLDYDGVYDLEQMEGDEPDRIFVFMPPGDVEASLFDAKEFIRGRKEAHLAWLDSHYPEWRNPMKYWSE